MESFGSYAAQLKDAVDVALVFFYLLPKADGLLHLVGVDVFGPPALHMVCPTADGLKVLHVYLETTSSSSVSPDPSQAKQLHLN